MHTDWCKETFRAVYGGTGFTQSASPRPFDPQRAILWSALAAGADGRNTARRFPLQGDDGEPIRTLTAAKEALESLRANRRESRLPQPGPQAGL
ncbi:MAG: hypothetical protein M3463_21420 [Verrucomicrobiota bacterium]|nr:hypothetical protein [Verrucomicrobiota bacterium]